MSHYILAKGAIEFPRTIKQVVIDTIAKDMESDDSFYNIDSSSLHQRIDFEMGESNGINYDPLDRIKNLCIELGCKKNLEIFTSEYVEAQGEGYHFDNLEDEK
jgi:hypothetical protein